MLRNFVFLMLAMLTLSVASAQAVELPAPYLDIRVDNGDTMIVRVSHVVADSLLVSDVYSKGGSKDGQAGLKEARRYVASFSKWQYPIIVGLADSTGWKKYPAKEWNRLDRSLAKARAQDIREEVGGLLAREVELRSTRGFKIYRVEIRSQDIRPLAALVAGVLSKDNLSAPEKQLADRPDSSLVDESAVETASSEASPASADSTTAADSDSTLDKVSMSAGKSDDLGKSLAHLYDLIATESAKLKQSHWALTLGLEATAVSDGHPVITPAVSVLRLKGKYMLAASGGLWPKDSLDQKFASIWLAYFPQEKGLGLMMQANYTSEVLSGSNAYVQQGYGPMLGLILRDDKLSVHLTGGFQYFDRLSQDRRLEPAINLGVNFGALSF